MTDPEEYFKYDPETGLITLIKKRRNDDTIGMEVGCLYQTGYRMVGLHGVYRSSHRLAWYLHYGEWPKDQIDHIDRDKLNNRIDNLRSATNRQNQQNTAAFNGGAFWQEHAKMWRSQIRVDGKTISLGYFKKEEKAKEAYSAYLEKLGEPCLELTS